MKRFETILQNEFRAWVENETTKITKKGNFVYVTGADPEGNEVVTTFNLNVLPVYTIG